MKGKACMLAVVAFTATSSVATATVCPPKHKPVKKPAKVKVVKKTSYVHFGGVAAWRSAQDIADAISVYVPVAGDPARAGYCAPVPVPRVGEQDGIFYNGYADDESRAFYHSLGFTDALVDPVSGSITC
jgi:hypothetical protein